MTSHRSRTTDADCISTAARDILGIPSHELELVQINNLVTALLTFLIVSNNMLRCFGFVPQM